MTRSYTSGRKRWILPRHAFSEIERSNTVETITVFFGDSRIVITLPLRSNKLFTRTYICVNQALAPRCMHTENIPIRENSISDFSGFSLLSRMSLELIEFGIEIESQRNVKSDPETGACLCCHQSCLSTDVDVWRVEFIYWLNFQSFHA